MSEEGWLMKSLREDPEYVEIEERVKREGYAAPQVQSLPGNHEETNAKIRKLLGKPVAPAEITPIVEQVYQAARQLDDRPDDADGSAVREALSALRDGTAEDDDDPPVEVHPDQNGLF